MIGKAAFILLSLLYIGTYLQGQVSNVGSDKFCIQINGNILKIPYYASHDLYSSNAVIQKAIVVVHGNNRNADDYFENMEIAANSVAELSANTLIIAPQFLTEEDIEFHNLDAEHLYWTSGGWKSGSNSRDEVSHPRPVRIPSYAVLDSLLLHIAQQFSNLELITVTGHSAGGQLTQRMAASSPIVQQLCGAFSIGIRFVVANPSSYVYMDNQRRKSGMVNQFEVPNTTCDDYNEWKYGLEDLYTYPESAGVDSIRTMFSSRKVIYLLGEEDNSPTSSSLDKSCAANLQGAHRYERGIIFYNYLQFYYGSGITENHKLVTVPNVGHSNFEIYNSSQGKAVLFEPSAQSCENLVSTKQQLKHVQINLFPNPSDGRIQFSGLDNLDHLMPLVLYDLQGREVWRGKISAYHPLDISHLAPGLYFLQFRFDHQTFRKRIIIQ